MRLDGGPAHNHTITPDPPENWVWVDIIDGHIAVFDLNRPETDQHPTRRTHGLWHEYEQCPHNPGVYQWTRTTPPLPR